MFFNTLVRVDHRYPGDSPIYHTNTRVNFIATPMVGVGNEIVTGVTMTRLGSQSSVVQEALGKAFWR